MTTLTNVNWWARFRGVWPGGQTRLDKGSEVIPFSGSTSPGGKAITPDTALKLSAVWQCVRIRSQTIASLPLHLRDKDKEIAVDHPLYRILHDKPNADMTISEYLEATIASLDLNGNAYSLIHRNVLGDVSSLEILPAGQVTPKRSKNGTIKYKYGSGSDEKTYNEKDILHIKGFTVDGLIGLSPIQYQAQAMGLQMDANEAASHEFKNNLKAGGFLKTGEAVLTAEQRDRLRNNLAKFAQPENAGKWMVLEAGVEPTTGAQMRINPQEAQLLESRFFGIEEICRAFSVPPQLIYQTNKASSWASSLENMNQGFLTYSLHPVLVRIEQAITNKLLKPEERNLYRPKFAVEGLLRSDSTGRANYYSTMVQNGIMDRNEVRGLEDLPSRDGADKLTVQLNLTPIDKLGADNAE